MPELSHHVGHIEQGCAFDDSVTTEPVDSQRGEVGAAAARWCAEPRTELGARDPDPCEHDVPLADLLDDPVVHVGECAAEIDDPGPDAAGAVQVELRPVTGSWPICPAAALSSALVASLRGG